MPTIVLIALSGIEDSTYIWVAWTFVIGRAIHTWVHCTTNRIRHRFYAYVGSSLVLWGIWLRIAIHFLG